MVTAKICKNSALPFVAFMLNNEDHDALVIAVTAVILVINIPICAVLGTLARLCDRCDQFTISTRRARAFDEAIDEHNVASNSRELLRAQQAALLRPQLCRRFGSFRARRVSDAEMRQIVQWVDACNRTKKALAMEAGRVAVIEAKIRNLSKPTKTENMARTLTHPDGKPRAKARFIFSTVGLLLLLASVIPPVLAPFAIIIHKFCDTHWPARRYNTAAFWIMYALLTVLPGVVAWLYSLRCLMHCRCEKYSRMDHDVLMQARRPQTMGIRTTMHQRVNGSDDESDEPVSPRTLSSSSSSPTKSCPWKRLSSIEE